MAKHVDVLIALEEGKNSRDCGRILYMRRLTAFRQSYKSETGKKIKTATPYFVALCDASFKLGQFHSDRPDDVTMAKLMQMMITMWTTAATKVLRHGGGSLLQRALNAVNQQN